MHFRAGRSDSGLPPILQRAPRRRRRRRHRRQAETARRRCAAMKRATRFMTGKVAYRGGYVWAYLPDFSRSWGEMEAKRTMMWVQPPGTATMGHAFLDAYHATGDEQFWRAAVVGDARADRGAASGRAAGTTSTTSPARPRSGTGTTPSAPMAGGWRNSSTTTATRRSTTPARRKPRSSCCACISNGRATSSGRRWRRRSPSCSTASIAIGGWPQRFPHAEAARCTAWRTIPRHITFNDDVAGENIKFLIMLAQSLKQEFGGDKRVMDPLKRAMDCFKATQQPKPQPHGACSTM